MTAATETTIPFMEWDQFSARFRWEQGEHLTAIGPTGQGKTTLILNLLPLRRYVVAFCTKPRDPVLRSLTKEGYVRMREWKPVSPMRAPRRLLWPKATNLDAYKQQKQVFTDALQSIYYEGGWCVYMDEAWYMTQALEMGREIKMYLLQARTLNISLALAAQRPRWIPVEVFDQSTHLFFFRDNDSENLRRIASIGYLDAQLIREAVARLRSHETLYVNSRSGELIRTMAPKKG